MKRIKSMVIEVVLPGGETGPRHELTGRVAQTVAFGHAAGARGFTALEANSWAYRLAHYVLVARRLGLEITMELEPHEGGQHGRYRLVTPIEIRAVEYEAEAA